MQKNLQPVVINGVTGILVHDRNNNLRGFPFKHDIRFSETNGRPVAVHKNNIHDCYHSTVLTMQPFNFGDAGYIAIREFKEGNEVTGERLINWYAVVATEQACSVQKMPVIVELDEEHFRSIEKAIEFVNSQATVTEIPLRLDATLTVITDDGNFKKDFEKDPKLSAVVSKGNLVSLKIDYDKEIYNLSYVSHPDIFVVRGSKIVSPVFKGLMKTEKCYADIIDLFVDEKTAKELLRG